MKNYFKILLVALIAMAMNVNLWGQNCMTNCLANAGPNKQICQSGPPCVTIGAAGCVATCPGPNPYNCPPSSRSYSWAPGGMTTCQPSVCPTVTTTYTLYVIFAGSCCCEGSAGGSCATACSTATKSNTVLVLVDLGSECFNPNTIEPIDNAGIKLLQEPANGKLKIQFAKIGTNTSIHIYDASGKLVIDDDGLDSSKKEFEYDLPELVGGTYFVQITEGQDVVYFQKQG